MHKTILLCESVQLVKILGKEWTDGFPGIFKPTGKVRRMA
jgi:hypothetical protein